MGGDLADVRLWAGELEAVHERFVHRFNREEPRQSALAYMRGLVAPLERKNGWTLAEEAGHAGPDRIHRLLNRIEWDADEVLDDVRDYVVEHLGDQDAVLIVDDTGFLKKGIRSAGVQRQYSGTAGRTENCQIGAQGRHREQRQPVVRSPHLRAEFLAAARAFRKLAPEGHPSPAESAALVQERLVLVLSRLLDLAAGRRARAPEPADARIAAVLDRLRTDLSGAPRLAELADEAGMSREHLIRTFTRATGAPPYAWHLSARLAEGRRRLRRGEPVADVAHGLGFADQAHFHRHFTAAYAITPGRYRRLSQINI